MERPAVRSWLESAPGLGYSAVMQDLIVGGVAIVWGIIILALRKELEGFAKPGGQGFRNAEFLRIVVVVAGIAVIGVGVAIILVHALRG